MAVVGCEVWSWVGQIPPGDTCMAVVGCEVWSWVGQISPGDTCMAVVGCEVRGREIVSRRNELG